MTLEQDWEAVSAELEEVRRSPWVGRVMRGGFPRLPVRDRLPEPSDLLAYSLVVLRGTPDRAYVCLRNASGTWGWRELGGGP